MAVKTENWDKMVQRVCDTIKSMDGEALANTASELLDEKIEYNTMEETFSIYVEDEEKEEDRDE